MGNNRTRKTMKTFNYNGLTFEKAGQFNKYGIANIWNHAEFSKHIKFRAIIMEINYNDFYNNDNKDTDVFRLEDGRLCTPICNKLIEFIP